MELPLGMGWVGFGHGKSDVFTADWTRVLEAVLNAHVTSFPPGLKVMTASKISWNEPGCLEVATRSIRRLLL